MLLEKCDSDIHEWVPGGIDGSEEVCRFCGWPKNREIFFLAQRVIELEQQHDAAVAILKQAVECDDSVDSSFVCVKHHPEPCPWYEAATDLLVALGADAKEQL